MFYKLIGLCIRPSYFVSVQELREFYFCKFLILTNLIMRHCHISTVLFIVMLDVILDCKLLEQKFLTLSENLMKTLDWFFPEQCPNAHTHTVLHIIDWSSGAQSYGPKSMGLKLRTVVVRTSFNLHTNISFFLMWILPVVVFIPCFFIF